jgi:hypothetical protein
VIRDDAPGVAEGADHRASQVEIITFAERPINRRADVVELREQGSDHRSQGRLVVAPICLGDKIREVSGMACRG